MPIRIRRRWDGKPEQITSDKGQATDFLLLFKDETGIWNREENLDTLDLPAVRGWLDIIRREYEERFIANVKRRKELGKRVVQTPRDRWDKVEKDKKHPYDYVISKAKKKIEEKKDD